MEHIFDQEKANDLIREFNRLTQYVGQLEKRLDRLLEEIEGLRKEIRPKKAEGPATLQGQELMTVKSGDFFLPLQRKVIELRANRCCEVFTSFDFTPEPPDMDGSPETRGTLSRTARLHPPSPCVS